jgi:hypothetical protein
MTLLTPRSEVFCDFFRITTPKEYLEDVLTAVAPYLLDMGCKVTEGAYQLPDTNGFFVWKVRHKVGVYQFSGQMAAALRANGALSALLAEFSVFPHRVSSADFTLDEYVPAPERLQSVYELASDGGVSFTRKAVTRAAVRKLFRPILYDYSGSALDTGTVYIGRLGSSEVVAKLYDKRNQLLAERGEDIRNTLRHELTVGGRMGITLRDIVQPEACFYHFYPANILTPPVHVQVWHGGSDGFELPASAEVLPAQRLKHRVEVSFDLEGMFGLCEGVGEGGLPLLLRLITNRYGQYQKASSFAG